MMGTAETVAWARDYYARGWTCVPLPAGAKSPPPRGSTGAGAPDLPLAQVEVTLADGGNLGLRMPDGVVGIDCDDYDDKGGAATLMMMEVGIAGFGESLGALPDSPRLTSRTDQYSGIRFYRVPAGTDLRDPGPGVETIRRSWRYAVAAPSVHPDTGNRYRWVWPNGAEGEPPAVADLPELPAAWVEHLRVEARTERAGPSHRGRGLSEREALELFRSFPGGEPCESVRRSGDTAMRAAKRQLGGAHNALLVPVFELLRMGTAGCPGAGVALLRAFQAYCLLDDGHDVDFLNMVAPKVEAAREDPWTCGGCITRSLASAPAPSSGADDGPAANPLGYVDFGDESFWSPAPPVWFIPGMLIEGEVCTIYSGGGQGKSLLAQDITLGLTARGAVFGQPVELQPVLYIDRENSARGLAKRFSAMGHTGPIPRLHYSMLGQWPPLDTAAGGAALLAEVRRTGARFVVLDTMSKMVDGEENANDTWNGLHSHSMVALKQAGVTVLQLDHTGKDETKGQRGGSSKQNNSDVIWKLSYAAGYVTLRNEKDREGEYQPAVNLERQEAPLLVHRATEAMPSAVARASDEEREADALVSMLDALKVPTRAGRPTCEAALRAAFPDLPLKTDRLAVAVRKRKEAVQ